MILRVLSLLPSFTPVQRFSKQPSVARLTCGTIFDIDFNTFILQLVYIVLASPSNLALRNQNVMMILTRSLMLHLVLEAGLFSVVVLFCKSVAQTKGGNTLFI